MRARVGTIARQFLLGTTILTIAVPSGAQQIAAAATVVPAGEAHLDSLLAKGRKQVGLRSNAAALRAWLDGVVGNPFSPILGVAGQLNLATPSEDSIAVVVARFKRFTDSTWTSLGTYLAQLPDDYDITVAWGHVLATSDSVMRRMLVNGAAVKGLLAPAQLSQFPPGLKSFFEPACASWFHDRLVNGLSSAPGVSPSRYNAFPACPAVK